MELHFWNTDNYVTYEEAKAASAIFRCDAPAYDSEVEQWGFNGGALCDAMQAVITALRCVGAQGTLDAVVVERGKVIAHWGEDDETP